MNLERKKDFEEVYDEFCILHSIPYYTPIYYALNIAESLSKSPPSGHKISNRERLIMNLDLTVYRRRITVPDAVGDYIALASDCLRREQELIKQRSVTYPVQMYDNPYLIDCYFNSLLRPSPLPAIFTKFECGWYVDYGNNIICFLDSSMKHLYQSLPKIFNKRLTLCILSEEFSNDEILSLHSIAAVSRVIAMSSGGHVSYHSSLSLFDDFVNKLYILKRGVTYFGSKNYIFDDILRNRVVSRSGNLIKKNRFA